MYMHSKGLSIRTVPCESAGGIVVHWKMKREPAKIPTIEQQRLIADIRKAEQEVSVAEWRFHHAVGQDQVDYAIYCLEAAEIKLSMLHKQAKWLWNNANPRKESEGAG